MKYPFPFFFTCVGIVVLVIWKLIRIDAGTEAHHPAPLVEAAQSLETLTKPQATDGTYLTDFVNPPVKVNDWLNMEAGDITTTGSLTFKTSDEAMIITGVENGRPEKPSDVKATLYTKDGKRWRAKWEEVKSPPRSTE